MSAVFICMYVCIWGWHRSEASIIERSYGSKAHPFSFIYYSFQFSSTWLDLVFFTQQYFFIISFLKLLCLCSLSLSLFSLLSTFYFILFTSLIASRTPFLMSALAVQLFIIIWRLLLEKKLIYFRIFCFVFVCFFFVFFFYFRYFCISYLFCL